MGLRGPAVWGGAVRAFGTSVVGAALLVLTSAPGARAATVDHFSIASASVTEGNVGMVNIAFTISYTGPSNNISVGWGTADGTAVAGADYVADSGTASFSATGPRSKTITVQVMGDLLDEANETFTVTLSNAQPPATADIMTATRTGTINDNDPTPAIVINDVSLPEANSETTMATFTLTLSAPSGRTVNVRATTANGTATQPADYTSTTTTLVLTPGVTTMTFSVSVVGDVLDEADDTFFVNLTSPTNVSIADARGVGIILDDDSVPTISDQRCLAHRRQHDHGEHELHGHPLPGEWPNGHGGLRDGGSDGRRARRLHGRVGDRDLQCGHDHADHQRADRRRCHRRIR